MIENKLDLAWDAINALGGRADVGDAYTLGYVKGIDDALAAIEALDGMNPAFRTGRPENPREVALEEAAALVEAIGFYSSDRIAADIRAL